MSRAFGIYQVDTTQQKVLKNGKPVKWGEKASRLFIMLLKETPKTISKEAIFAEVWKGRVVTENTLYKTISNLRQELNQQDIEIESVFGEGYRIIQTSKVEILDEAVESTRFNWHKLVWFVAAVALVSVLWVGWKYHKSQQLYKQMSELEQVLAVTKQAFISQIGRRNELGEVLSERFVLKQEDSWEKRFYQLYDQMNEQERFLCQQTRAYTEGPLYENNHAALKIMLSNPDMLNELSLAQELITHLTIWLNKYKRVFVDSEKMCLLYVGVEDGAQYPSGFDQQLAEWLNAHQK